MIVQNNFLGIGNMIGLQSNQIKKVLQSNQDNKTNLNYKVLKDIKYSNLKCNKYNNAESIVENKYNVKSKDKTDEINLCCKDKPNKHCITDYDSARLCKNFIVSNSTKQ
ncbi:hypothetical protein [Nitrosopumilus ureiphilus]|uniref:Uncharacterized protein n=1 Tax=Nitrosopumilus ureiphilus TaxID=1470067 RepID=A0A7D5R2Q7_9ARCH|nr:hypothetical protein [Nitrosopumilus ureiphilus]QLH07676.1 hypothetical protein C5F50_11790 [Nitrosopumilus ureiphilus]